MEPKANLVPAFKMSVGPLDDDDDDQENIPSDVITEILLHLSPKSLLKHQLVCKEWQFTIFGHHFEEKYENHTATEFYCNYLDESSEPESSSHLSQTGSVSKLCDRYGLLLMLIEDDKKYCLWNPAIHKLLDMPSPHQGSDLFALSYLPTTRNYKILSLYKDEQSGDGFEIFTIGHSKAWRCLTSLSDISQVTDTTMQMQTSLVSTGQDIHCVRVLDNGNESCGEVISFDMANESFSVTPLPKPFLYWYWLLEWDGKLGFVGIIGENLHVVVLEDYRKQKWSECKKIPLPIIKKEKGKAGSLFPLFCKNGNVWFWLEDGNKILSYSPETGLVQDVLKLPNNAILDDLCPYKPSLVSFVGMQPDTKLEPYRCSEGLMK